MPTTEEIFFSRLCISIKCQVFLASQDDSDKFEVMHKIESGGGLCIGRLASNPTTRVLTLGLFA